VKSHSRTPRTAKIPTITKHHHHIREFSAIYDSQTYQRDQGIHEFSTFPTFQKYKEFGINQSNQEFLGVPRNLELSIISRNSSIPHHYQQLRSLKFFEKHQEILIFLALQKLPRIPSIESITNYPKLTKLPRISNHSKPFPAISIHHDIGNKTKETRLLRKPDILTISWLYTKKPRNLSIPETSNWFQQSSTSRYSEEVKSSRDATDLKPSKNSKHRNPSKLPKHFEHCKLVKHYNCDSLPRIPIILSLPTTPKLPRIPRTGSIQSPPSLPRIPRIPILRSILRLQAFPEFQAF